MMKSQIQGWIAAVIVLVSMMPMATASVMDVKVGMSGRYFPFTFIRQGALQGFEVDLWNEIARRNDMRVHYITANFSNLFNLLETGRIDTISNQITITKDRQAKFLFSQPYVIDGAQISVHIATNDIQGLEDLNGKTVAVNLGSNFEQLLRQYDKNHHIKIKTYDTGMEDDVALGRVDAFIMDRLSTLEVIKRTGLPLKTVGQPFTTIENAWPFTKDEKGKKLQAKINATLHNMRVDGTLKKLSMKWFDSDVTQ